MPGRWLEEQGFALDPNDARAANLRRHAGAARFAYNWA
ncbi:helix-turn-helix domain-containing protein, partial [Frankia canadensis]